MDTNTKNTLLVLGLIVLTIVLYRSCNRCECEARISYDNVNLNQDIDLDRLFQPAHSNELNTVRQVWRDTDLHSDSFRIVTEFRFAGGRDVQIIEQYKQGAKHYGAICIGVLVHANDPPPCIFGRFGWTAITASGLIRERSAANE